MRSMTYTGFNRCWKKTAGFLLAVIILPLISVAQFNNTGVVIEMNSNVNLVLNDISFKNEGVFFNLAGKVSFTGSVPATISGGAQNTFSQLEINKPGSSLQLQRGIIIYDRLIFTEGLLDLNNNYILLYSNALLTGERESSRITGLSGGYVQISQFLDAPTAYNPGNLGVTISSSANLGNVTIRRGHQLQANPYGGGNSILRYYDIIPQNNNALNATLRLTYFDGELNGLNENNLNLWKKNGNGSWTDLSKNLSSTATNFVEQAGINDFTRFTLSTFGNTLPLKWSSFNTECSGNQVRINWKTEQEQNTSQFFILRSIDARSWTKIATLPAAGNSNAVLSYAYVDQQSYSGISYYQIQQQDFDGRLTLSPILSNNCGAAEELKVFPNPVLNNCWVSLQVNRGGPLSLKLFDSKGALVMERQEMVNNGNNLFSLQLQKFAKGIYTLLVKQTDGNSKVVKIEKY